MADDALDPRDAREHPRRLPPLIGHEKQEAQLVRAAASGRIHHAWMLCGPPGIGKATLAYRFAAYLLSGASKSESAGRLSFDQHSPAAHWIRSQSHPDLYVLERAFDRKTRKLKTDISVEDARGMLQFFSKTAGTAGWKIAIVDPADDLNQASANAILKIMEEPPARSLLLLVCNHPSRLLRTIRSRCSRLDLSALTMDQTRTIVDGMANLKEGTDPEALELAISMSGGSPGTAADLVSADGAKAFKAFQSAASLSPQTLVELGSRFAGRLSTVEDFEIFCGQLQVWVGDRGRTNAQQGSGQRLARAFSEIDKIRSETLSFNLDRRQATIRALTLVEQALR